MCRSKPWWFWIHEWNEWQPTEHLNAKYDLYEWQRRTCKKCGLVQRKKIFA